MFSEKQQQEPSLESGGSYFQSDRKTEHSGIRWEALGPGLHLCVSREHTFGTDALLLSDFAAPRKKDIVCDLGSGCGIVPALWFRNPEQGPEKAWALELQPEAVALMERSIKEGGLPPGRFVPVQGDLRELPLGKGSCDLVTCNPPYYPAASGAASAQAARCMARHETTCTLEDACKAAAFLLHLGGRFCLCHRPERLAEVFQKMQAQGMEPKRLRFVQQKPEKPPRLFLLEGRLGGKASLRVEAPFYLEEAGKPSQEMARIYGGKEGGAVWQERGNYM